MFEALGARTIHLGPLGAGARMKLAVNAAIYGLNQEVTIIDIDEAGPHAAAERVNAAGGQEAEDIGEAVAFLASELARNITGESVDAKGGQLMD